MSRERHNEAGPENEEGRKERKKGEKTILEKKRKKIEGGGGGGGRRGTPKAFQVEIFVLQEETEN